MAIFLFILILTLSGARGQLYGSRLISDALGPFLRGASELSGHAFTSGLNSFTSLPIAVTRLLGINGGIPTLINGNNVVELTDRIVGDFNIRKNDEDANLNITSLLLKYGKSVEEHVVVTDDGYVLTMFRIPGNGPVVFLMHGLLGSADDYVMMGPENGLAYILSNEGYDVWLGNARGNKHSKRHTHLLPSDAAFWDFSWHEIGIHDLPTMIDYVLQETGKDQVKYIGHSQGTTSFFVMASEKPEYNKKISLMVALSPVAFMTHVKSPIIRALAIGGPLLHAVTKTLGVYEFLPSSSLMRAFSQVMCGTGTLAEIMCGNAVFLTVGFGFNQLNATHLPVVNGHFPSGAAVKQFAHYAQGIISGDFQKFNYGPQENIERYGSTEPPSYPLENILAPISLFYSSEDWLANPIDVDTLYNKLNNAVDIHNIPYDPFNHIDYVTAKDVKALVYNRLVKLLRHF